MKFTAVGSAYWEVLADGVVQSPKHSQQFEAAEHAVNLVLADPKKEVIIRHNAQYKVEYSVQAPSPVPAPAPAPAPAPQPDPIPVPAPEPVPAPTPSVLTTDVYTDLASAPVGAFVTVYGIVNAIASSWPIVFSSNEKTVVKVPDATTPLVIDGATIPISIHQGRILEATPATLASVFKSMVPGDVIYLRAGTYSEKYDGNGWNESNFVVFQAGTAEQPCSLVSYPGETVVIDNRSHDRPNFYLGNSGGGLKGSYLTIAGMHLIANLENIYGGGNTSNSNTPESGAAYVRLVRNTFELANSTQQSMTGMLASQGDAWKILGNTFVVPSDRIISNMDHAIYVQNGSDDVEIAYNTLVNLRMGHTIQVHQDGVPALYSNIWIHDNLIQGASANDCRGISISNVDVNSTVKIEKNTLRRVGQGFGAVTVYRGQVEVRNNVFEDISAPGISVNGNYGGSRTVRESGNTYMNVSGGNFSAENGTSLNDIIHE